MKFTIRFTLEDLDDVGEEHRLVIWACTPRDALGRLYLFARRLLMFYRFDHLTPEEVKREIVLSVLRIHSIWVSSGGGRFAVSAADFLHDHDRRALTR